MIPRLPVNEGMKSSQRVNVKVAAIEKNEVLLRVWSFVLIGFAVVGTAFLVELRIAAVLGLF
jgi:hypothetical protein